MKDRELFDILEKDLTDVMNNTNTKISDLLIALGEMLEND